MSLTHLGELLLRFSQQFLFRGEIKDVASSFIHLRKEENKRKAEERAGGKVSLARSTFARRRADTKGRDDSRQKSDDFGGG